jgi:hypothetical protein
MFFLKDGVILSLLFMVKSYLYLIKSANLVFRNNCTDLSLNMMPRSLPSEQVVVCLFVFLTLQLLWLYFHSPVAGFRLLVFEVS